MTQAAAQMLDELLQLPERDRADLAVLLIDSLDPDVDSQWNEAWDAEISKRISDLDRGDVKTTSWTDLQLRLKERLHARAQD